jgi:hypothetical protein
VEEEGEQGRLHCIKAEERKEESIIFLLLALFDSHPTLAGAQTQSHSTLFNHETRVAAREHGHCAGGAVGLISEGMGGWRRHGVDMIH